MLYESIKLEVEQLVNSQEGLERLIERLLWKLPSDSPLVADFRRALASYVYAKRTTELYYKKGVQRPWWKRSFGSLNVELEHEVALEIESRLIAELGATEVCKLKKEIGKSLQGLLSRDTK